MWNVDFEELEALQEAGCKGRQREEIVSRLKGNVALGSSAIGAWA